MRTIRKRVTGDGGLLLDEQVPARVEILYSMPANVRRFGITMRYPHKTHRDAFTAVMRLVKAKYTAGNQAWDVPLSSSEEAASKLEADGFTIDRERLANLLDLARGA